MAALLTIPFILLAIAGFLICYYWPRGQGYSSPVEPVVRDHEVENINGSPTKISWYLRINAFFRRLYKRATRNYPLFLCGIFLFSAVIFYIVVYTNMDQSAREYLTYKDNLSYALVNLEKPWLLNYGSIVMNVLLALIYGFIIYAFISFLKRYEAAGKPPPKGLVVLWVVALVLVPAFGLFKSEAKTLLASIKRLETPAGAIEFGSISKESGVSLYFGDKTPTATVTNFQAGVERLTETLRFAQTDFENIVKFCKPEAVGGPRCAPRFGGPNAGPQIETEKLLSSMAVTYEYASAIKPIAICLSAYGCFYENGVPIQDDLSEIAASYATPPVVSDRSLGCPEVGPRDPMCDPLTRILKHLRSFKQEGWNDAEKAKCYPALKDCLEGETNPLPPARNVIAHRNAVLATNQSHQAGFILPYRSMLSAALLTASGYPAEAVGHMERQYNKLVKEFTGADGSGEGRPDFVEIILRLRLLYAMQQAAEHANNQSLKLKYQKMERALAKAHLSSNLGVDGSKREMLLEQCAPKIAKSTNVAAAPEPSNDHKKFVDWLQRFPKTQQIKMKEFLRWSEHYHDEREKNTYDAEIRKIKMAMDGAQKVLDDFDGHGALNIEFWNNYRKNFILYFVNADFERFHAIARQSKLRISETDLRDTQAWWKIANEKPYLIDSCFEGLPEEYIEYLKFRMVYVFGLLHAEKAQRLSQAAELARSGFTESGSIPVDMYEVQGIACMGYNGLRRAYNIGKGLADMNIDWGNAIADEMRQTPSMLRQLAKYLTSTDSECLN